MNKRNVKWHQLTADATVQQLHTNASSGLSRKEARSRYRKYGPNTLFDSKNRSKSPLFKELLTDPSCITLMIACVLTLCFSRSSVGVSTLICFAVGLSLVAHLLYTDKKLSVGIEKYRIPQVRVIREGKEFVTAARNVTLGDVIYLKKGDIVPADCRLLSATSLHVLALQSDAKGHATYQMQLKCAERVYAYGEQIEIPTPENMIYGGSEIVKGEGRAVVTAIGKETYLGGMESFELPAEFGAKKAFGGVYGVHPYLRLYSLLLFVLLVPLSVLGMLTAPKDMDIMYVFLSLCALVCGGSQAILLCCFHAPNILLKDEHFRNIQRDDRAVIKSAHATEELAALTDLFVLGREGSSDGLLHLYRFANGNGEYAVGDLGAREPLMPVCEAFLLRRQAESVLPTALEDDTCTDPFETLCKELITATGGFDTEAMAVRLLRVALAQKTTHGDTVLDVEMKDDQYRLLFSERTAWLSHCTFFEDHRKARLLDFAARAELQRFAKEAREDGCEVQLVMRQRDDHLSLLGIVALREQMQTTLPSVLEELKQCGVRVSFFLQDETDATLQYATAAKLSDRCISASAVRQNKANLTAFYEKYRVFVGFSEQEIAMLLQVLKHSGRRVAVLGNRFEELSLLRSASLSIACDALSGQENERERTASEEMRTPQAVRRHADVLIHRATRTGGGTAALLRLISDCRALDFRMAIILKFLLVCAIPPLMFTVLSVVTGVGLMSGAMLLIGGVLVELLGMLWLLSLFIPQNRLRKQIDFHQKRVEQILRTGSVWLPSLCASALTGIYTLILHFCVVFTAEMCKPYLFASMLLLQLTELILTAMSSGTPPTLRQVLIPILTVTVPSALFISFSVAFPAIDRILGLGSWNLVSFLSLLLPPVFCLGFRIFGLAFFNRTAK